MNFSFFCQSVPVAVMQEISSSVHFWYLNTQYIDSSTINKILKEFRFRSHNNLQIHLFLSSFCVEAVESSPLQIHFSLSFHFFLKIKFQKIGNVKWKVKKMLRKIFSSANTTCICVQFVLHIWISLSNLQLSQFASSFFAIHHFPDCWFSFLYRMRQIVRRWYLVGIQISWV